MQSNKRILFTLCSLVLATGASADTVPQSCGTHLARTEEELFLHGRHAARDPRVALRSTARRANRDLGEIAILEDAGGVVGRRNAFTLNNRTLLFRPQDAVATRYRVIGGDDSFDAAANQNGFLIAGLADDDSRAYTLPFSFPFYGQRYTQVWINSDGNLTFTGPDPTVTDRSLGRLLAGLPRIAPLFTDLNPPQARGGISVLPASNRLVITWSEVPVFSSFGASALQTFQVRLYPDGRIEFAYRGASAPDSVVGISPGGLRGPSAIIPLYDGSTQEFTGAIAERFSSSNEIDLVTAAQRFYETHEDAYDYLIFYNALGIPASSSAVAFQVTVRSATAGIGDKFVNAGADFGSGRRLQAVLNMGPLTQYPADPNAPVPARFPTGDTPLSLLAHEFGHLFLAFTSIRDPNNPAARPMLGRGGVHWAFAYNSDASFLEGNRIADQGVNAVPRFVTTAAVEKYSAMDQYLMGFRAPEEVPGSFVVLNATVASASRAPQVGVNFNGMRREVNASEIVALEGRRAPDHTVAQRTFRVAFVLIVPTASTVAASDLAQVESYRTSFPGYFAAATENRAAVETTQRRAVQFSAAPARGIVFRSGGSASVEIEERRSTDLVFAVRSRFGFTGVPEAVTIPAGATRATFTLRGLQTGVDEVTLEPSDPAFERVAARIQILEFGPALRVTVGAGDKQPNSNPAPLPQPVVFQVTDANRLGYPGLPVRAIASSGGTVEPTEVISDENGNAAFRWTPAPGGINILEASIPAIPTAVARATALGRPTIAANGIVNAASFATQVAPGSFVSIFGGSLAAGFAGSFSSPFTTRFNDITVSVNGVLARLVSVTDNQINILVPQDLNATIPATVTVVTPAGQSEAAAVRVAPAAPGIFFDAATGLGAILVANTGLTTAQRPVAAGDFLEIYCTGLGVLRTDGTTGFTPQVTVGGRPAELFYSGRTGVNGLYQVNVRVPNGVFSGLQDVQVTANGVASNTVKIQVR